uniref:BPTI/Kunitz inhibitor domain-containing protein n=1 Tax=Caenorhabditis tropicalis TaxID=1561998 RepID=A0A1I7TYW9_9PELO
MYSILIFSAIVLTFSSSVYGLQDECKLPLDMGKSPCKTGKKEIRYHFDVATYIPLAFEYTGCGGNKNNFKSEDECRLLCLGYDYTGCATGVKETKVGCQSDKECGPKSFCQFQPHFNICCDKEITKKFQADWEPKCPKGKKVHQIKSGGIPITVVGKTCKSKFCPSGATCVEGNYIATCCK